MAVDITKTEITVYFILALYLLFTSTNINSTLGLTFAAFLAFALIFIIIDPKRSLKLRKQNDSLLGSIAKGAFAYVGLLLMSTFVLVPGINKIIDLLGATTPALATSVFFNNLTFGGAVPIAETLLFFAVAPDILSSIFNIRIDRGGLGKIKSWIMIIGISLAFMFFHLTAKGINNAEVLAVVFFMAIISLFLVFWDGSYESAIWFHIIANTSALVL